MKRELVCTTLAGVVIAFIAAAYEPLSWWFDTALYSVLVGGILFIIIGFIVTRMTKAAPPPLPLVPLPPPPPP